MLAKKAKLCIAPCKELQGVVVGGGENKSLFGQDFRFEFHAMLIVLKFSCRLQLLSSQEDGLLSWQSRASRRDSEQGEEEKGGEEEERKGGEEELDQSLRAMLDEMEGREVVLQAMKLQEEDIEDLSLKERLNVKPSLSPVLPLNVTADEQDHAGNSR
eukprot:757005-Hanusia_phi.AAC.3